MSNEDKKYSAEFKSKVAKEAIEQDKQNLERLSKKHDVPVSTILTWVVQLEKNPESAFTESDKTVVEKQQSVEEDVDLEVTDEEISASIQHGVMYDKLNIRRLTFWSILGIVLVLLFIQALIEMYQFNRDISQEAASSTEFYQVNQQNKEATETLNSFGVVDLENGIYRIPIDSAINEIVEQQ